MKSGVGYYYFTHIQSYSISSHLIQGGAASYKLVYNPQ